MTSLKSSGYNTLTAVRQCLQAQPALADAPVRLTLLGNVLHLHGRVATHYQKHLAERLLRDLGDVRVVNGLEVKRTLPSPLLVKRLYRNSLRQRDLPKISARVEGRTILLEGRVENWREREQVEQLALALPGINTVVNTIRLEAQAKE